MPTLRQAIKRLRDRWILPTSGTVSVRDLDQRFRPVPSGSMRSLLLNMKMLADVAQPVGGSTHPYYRRSKPAPQNIADFNSDNAHIDLTNAHMDAYVVSGPVISMKQVVKRLRDHGTLPPSETISVKDLNQRFRPVPPGSMRSLLLKMLDPVAEANRLFDKRAAAAVSGAAKSISFSEVIFVPSNHPSGGHFVPYDPVQELLEVKSFGGEPPDVVIPTAQCLAVIAYPDYFPGIHDINSWRTVSKAILLANPGWCGTVGPGGGGDYDMSQMHLLQIAYRYYDELYPDARELLIRSLLARGRIRRYGTSVDDFFTSGRAPNDWSRAGHIGPARIGETENHILTMHTARYLTNQLLHQRDHDPDHDNRRNGSEDAPTCTDLMLYLLRNILRDDFSEYNAKNYQTQTRYALLNLCNYAYDHEVRLGARMVLDYISAHIAVSSNDLRRMVPFRRRNEAKNVTRSDGYMEVGLLETTFGADPMAQHFAILAGNTRAYEKKWKERPNDWSIKTDGTDGNDAVMYALSDYRLPPSIHDLFVNDLHRRFFQRIHRTFQDDVEVTGRNADNYEIYAGSPSYLISAGGSPATYAIDPTFLGFTFGDNPAQQLGVAVTTSFMPTGSSAGPGTQNSAGYLIQFSSFSQEPGKMLNYGVAPDFACGHRVHLPDWCLQAIVPQRRGKFDFVNKRGADGRPGFYLALLRDGDFAVMEAFDTWLHPNVTFEQFKSNVWEKNKHLSASGLNSNVEAQYTTQNGNHLRFVIWKDGEGDGVTYDGARILSIEYGTGDPLDSEGDAGRATDQFLRGTVMNSKEAGVVEITNHFLDRKIRLDMSDQWHPRRTSGTGEVEEAGSNHEVWVDFGWRGPSEGDFFRPFNTITAAAAAVADGGVIKIVPGWTTEKPAFQRNKRTRLVAPIGGVTFGVR